MLRGFVLVLVLGLVLAASRPALAYGPATHAWLGAEACNRLAAADPTLAFLATDVEARACFQYGSILPDMRGIPAQAAAFETMRQKIMQGGFVSSVEFATDDVATAFASFETHSASFLLSLALDARATGDRYKIAFALGNLAHALEDKHSQLCNIPSFTQRAACGDLGVEPVADPAAVAGWYPGYENEFVFEGLGDVALPAASVELVRDLPWRLHANATVSYSRALELRRFYWESAARYALRLGRTPPTERGVQNAAKLFEAGLTFYGFATAKEPAGDAIRRFGDRYLRLSWWAATLAGTLQAIAFNLTGGQDLFDVVGPIVASIAGGEIAGHEPLAEIIFAHASGGAEVARIRAKYAGNAEYARLEASGLLDRATYVPAIYDGAQVLIVDGLLRGAASRFNDDARWPIYSRKVMKAAGVRSLLRATGRDDIAAAPELLVFDVRHRDASSGAAFAEVAIPADAGRRLRTEVEVFGAGAAPEARILRLRLRADTGQGPGDPVLAARTEVVPAAALSLGTYADHDRPVLAVEWTVAEVPGARGVYVELDERRPTPVRGDEAADALFRGELSPLDPLTGGRPHYARHYVTYGTPELPALRVRR